MKHTILSLFFLISTHYLFATVVVQVDSIFDVNQLPSYKVEITSTGSKLHVVYLFDTITVARDPIFTNMSNVFIGGFGNATTEGKAAVPILLDRFSIPSGCSYEIENVEANYAFWGKVLAPARPTLPETSDYSFQTVSVTPIEPLNSFYPVSLVSDCGVQTFRGHNIANILVSPVAYNSGMKVVRFCSSLSFYIKFIADGSSSSKYSSEEADLFIKSITSQPDNGIVKMSSYDTKKNEAAELSYIILTTDDLKPAAYRLSEWKRKMGYSVDIISQSVWEKEDVLRALSAWYDIALNPNYGILFGDANKIAPYKLSNDTIPPHTINYNVASDFKYACMDGPDDIIPDIFLGRIPASSLEDANNAVNKILSYEENPLGGLTETKVVYSTFFQDASTFNKNPDGYEDRDYTRTTELIYNAFPNKFDDRERIYYCLPNVYPQRWSKQYSNGAKIPLELQKPMFNWNGNATDIINAINNGCTMFFHRDHGEVTGWSYPKFKVSDLDLLQNETFPIMFSIDCLTGKYIESNNFAKKILCGTNGVASIIAASEVTYSGQNDALACAMFGSLFPEKGFMYNGKNINTSANLLKGRANSIGAMLNIGLINMDRQYSSGINDVNVRQRERYHCFGDPSLSVCWNSSKVLSTRTSITEFGGFITVDIDVNKAYISFYDTKTGKHKRVFGNYVSFESENPSDVFIAVTYPGWLPVIGLFGDIATVGENNPKDNYIDSFELNGRFLYVNLVMKYSASFGTDGRWALNAYLQSGINMVTIASIQLNDSRNPIEIILPETKKGDIIRLTRGNEIIDKKGIIIKN